MANITKSIHLITNLVIIFNFILKLQQVYGLQNAHDKSSLSELRKVFTPPNVDDKNAIFIKGEISKQDITIIEKSESSKVCILLEGVYDDVIPNVGELDLNRLQNVSSAITELWLLGNSKDKWYERQVMNYTEQKNRLYVKELHVTIPLTTCDYDFKTLLNDTSASLKVLNLRNVLCLHRFKEITLLLNDVNLTGLKALALSALSHNEPHNLILNLTNIFEPMRNRILEYVDFSNNGFVSISGSFTQQLPKLRIIDLSKNMFTSTPFPYNLVFIELITLHTEIEVAIIEQQNSYECSSQHKPSMARFKRSQYNMLPSFNICMKTYNISMNQLPLMTKPSFCQFLKCIVITDKADSKYILSIVEEINALPCEFLPSFTDIMTKYIDKTGKCLNGIQYPLSPRLKQLHLNFFNPSRTSPKSLTASYQNTICFQKNTLETISLANSPALLQKGFFSSEIASLFSTVGISSMQNLDLSYNQLHISLFSNLITSWPSLKFLSMAGNYLSIEQNKTLRQFFPILNTLDLSLCSLTNNDNISKYFLSGSVALQNLNLAGNYLDILELRFNDVPNLKNLNLSFNQIGSFDSDTIQDLKQTKSNNIISIDLKGNPVSCGCLHNEIETIELVQNSAQYNLEFIEKNLYRCSGLKSQFLLEIDLSKYKQTCQYPHLNIILSTTLGNTFLVLLLVFIFIGHRYRYRLFTYYLHFKRSLEKTDNQEFNFTYDAFISYCAEDRFWVHQTLVKELETKYGFKLCIHYRDFTAGETIANEIHSAITESKMVVVVLSENSLKSEWCEYELDVAHARSVELKTKLLVIKLGNIDMDGNRTNITPLVDQLLTSKVYANWPEEWKIADEQENNVDENNHDNDDESNIEAQVDDIMLIQNRTPAPVSKMSKTLWNKIMRNKQKTIEDQKVLFWMQLSDILYAGDLHPCICCRKKVDHSMLQSIS